MQHNSFVDKANEYLRMNNIVLESTQLERLSLYYKLSLDWGIKMNITNNLDPESYLCENFLDPILGFNSYLAAGYSVRGLADFGAGGGYVGVTAKILMPNLERCVLIESIRKKVSFIQMVIRELGLDRTEAIQARAEDFSLPESVDLVVSRATWNWSNFRAVILKLGRPTVKTLSFEGPTAHKEQSNPPSDVIEYQINPFSRTRFLYCE